MSHLTQAQLNTVNTAIMADTTARGFKTAGDSFSLLAWLNADAPGPVKAWITLSPQDIDQACDFSAFDTIVAGKRDSWGYFLRFNRDFSVAKVRKWVTDVWGNATSGSVAEAILIAATRNANRIENILGGSSKTTGTVTALALNLVGPCDQEDCAKLVNM